MSRKATVLVEDEFDDNTDLPLPIKPLPNTGAKGPLLQEIASDDDSEDLDFISQSQRAGPASPPPSQSQFRPDSASQLPKNTVTDITPYKSYVLVIRLVRYRITETIYQMDMHIPYLH